MWWLFHGIRAVFRFPGYGPQPVSVASTIKWIKQFDKQDRRLACRLLDKVIYFSKKKTKAILLHQNQVLMDNLRKAGLPPRKLIYIQTDDAGSSSPVMLNMIRDEAGLQQQGCKFLDSRDALGINHITNRLEEGALIYIDDFVGTGDQFCAARNALQQSVVGNFAEFLLVPSICEEAYQRLNDLGIGVCTGHIHSRAERPLHSHSHLFKADDRERMIDVCRKIRPKMSLGYNDLATMVVLYRNSPNSIPAILRGSDKLAPFCGMFPRYKDLPIKKSEQKVGRRF